MEGMACGRTRVLEDGERGQVQAAAMGEKWPRGCNTKPLPRNPSGLQVWGAPRLLFVLLWGWCSAPLGDARALGPSWAQLGSRRWPRAMTRIHLPAQLRPQGQEQPHREPGAPCDVHLGVLIRFGMGMEALWLGQHPHRRCPRTGPAPSCTHAPAALVLIGAVPASPRCSGHRSWHSNTQLPARSPRGGSRLSRGLSTSLCPSEPWVGPLLGTTPRELAVDEQPASAPLKFGACEPRQQGCDRGGSALL